MGEAFGPLLQEAREKIKHVEPWQRGTQRTPSTAFCILVRLFQLGLTEAHMTKLLAQKDRPLVRAVGFLYLRYVLKPELLWRYCEDVLIDDGRAILEEGRKETLGEWLRGVLTSQQYHGTQLPRIPTKIDRDIRARVALVDESRERASDNARYLDRFEPGCQVRAIYGDQKNEPAWYDAIVESIEKDTDDAGKERVRFQVQFPDYGHGALVRLGDLDTRNNDSNGESLLKGKKLKVAQSQQSQAAPDKFTYSRPKGYKETLALKMDHASDRLERERARHGEEPSSRDDRYRPGRRDGDDARPRSRRDDDARYERSRRDDYDRSRRDRRDRSRSRDRRRGGGRRRRDDDYDARRERRRRSRSRERSYERPRDYERRPRDYDDEEEEGAIQDRGGYDA
jgi:pre-mRNA-splicing factor 38B